MIVAAFSYRVFQKIGNQRLGPKSLLGQAMITKTRMVDQALKTPQFWQLWIMLCFNVGSWDWLIGVAKTMVSGTFGANEVLISMATTAILLHCFS